jgi:acetyl-CoA acetyltransferase family protein
LVQCDKRELGDLHKERAMATKEIVLAGGMRTPFGDFGKSLKDVPLTVLGLHAAKACLEKAKADPAKVDHLVWGNVLPVDHDGYFASRVIALKAGMPINSSALNVSRACGSGAQAIITAAEQILSGHSCIALAGGGENFSRGPYVITNARWGLMRGRQDLIDTLDWAYRDPFSSELMGETAENLTDEFGYSRHQMDEWAVMSQQRAGAAMQSGFLARQIAPINVPERRAARLMEMDEFPRPRVTTGDLAKMKPVFRKDGRITAGNSSGVTDGAAFVVVGDRAAVEAAGIEPLARIVDWSIVGVPPPIMGCGPVPAIQELFKRTGKRAGDVDYFEINEAFAAVSLHAEKHLGVSRAKTNLYGGGISIGHPPGATGVRMTIVAMQHLAENSQRTAVVSMCLGAGHGMALMIEKL